VFVGLIVLGVTEHTFYFGRQPQYLLGSERWILDFGRADHPTSVHLSSVLMFAGTHARRVGGRTGVKT